MLRIRETVRVPYDVLCAKRAFFDFREFRAESRTPNRERVTVVELNAHFPRLTVGDIVLRGRRSQTVDRDRKIKTDF